MSNINEIKVPLAIEKETNKLVDSTMVANGDACNCYCPLCGEDLRAINKEIKQKAHFKHLPESNCNRNWNGETYIHKVTKVILKDLTEIQLPEITRYTYSNEKLQKRYKQLIVENLELDFKKKKLDFIKIIPYQIKLKDKFKFNLKETSEEVVFNTTEGNIRADLISYNSIKNGYLLIEPYLTSEINDMKMKKIVSLNHSVLSINLRLFISENGWDFTLLKLKEFLINDLNSKNWEYLNSDYENKLLDGWFKRLISRINEFKIELEQSNKLAVEIDLKKKRLEKERAEILSRLGKIVLELDKLNVNEEDDLCKKFYSRIQFSRT